MISKQAKQEEAHRIDVLLNQAAIPLARSRKLIESWLPLSAEEEQGAAANAAGIQGNPASDSSRSDAQLETTKPEEFVPRNERAGLGSEAATERSMTSGPRGSGLSAEMEKLRVQLLGRKAASRLSAAAAKKQSSLGLKGHAVDRGKLPDDSDQGGKKRKVQQEEEDDEEEDEEAGRSSVFKSKHQKNALAQSGTVLVAAKREVDEGSAAREVSSEEDTENVKVVMGTVSKPHSYLDEILQQRQNKKRKRTKKKKKKEQQQQQENDK